MAERQIDLTLSVQDQHFHRLLGLLEDDEYTHATLTFVDSVGNTRKIPISDIERYRV